MEHTTGNMKQIDAAHHAYVVFGGGDVKEKLFAFLEKDWKVETTGNPDFWYQKFETFGIDDARNLKESHERKSFTAGDKKIFIIEAGGVTLEAQNSLLKMLEEPVENTYFFLIGGCVKNLIPTLLSRVAKVDVEGTPAGAAPAGAEAFFSLPKAKRLAFVKKLTDDIKDEKKSRAEALSFLNDLETFLYSKFKNHDAKIASILKEIEMCRDFASDRSASLKMLLEYVALIVPARTVLDVN